MTRRLWSGSAILAALVWLLPSDSPGQAAPPSPAKSASAPRAPLDQGAASVTARCQLRSDVDVRVRCEVLGTGGEGVMILEVLPEGTQVKKGDVVLRFDASALEDRQMEQEILVQRVAAGIARAALALEAAKAAKAEFAEGAYPLQQAAVEAELMAAEEKCREREESLRQSREGMEQRKAPGGPPRRPEPDPRRIESSLARAKAELSLAQRKLAVLEKLTKPKTLLAIDGAIQGAEADLLVARAEQELQTRRLARTRGQIARCTVLAPQDGQVFHSTGADAETGRSVRIAEGVRVRTFQEVVRLRDPRQMRAVGRVPSAQAGRITPGLLVVVFLDALPAVKLSGVVDQVRDVSTTASTGPAREVTVHVVDPPEGLRSGMSGEMRIALPKP